MGCSASKAAVADLKTRLVVSVPSERGRILDGPAPDRTDAANNAAIVLTLTWKYGDKPPSLDCSTAATGNVVLSVAGFDDSSSPLSFFADGKLVALKDKPTGFWWSRHTGFVKPQTDGYWDFWTASPAVSGQQSAKTVEGVPMYYWGLFKYDHRTHGPIQYVEQHDQKLANEARRVVTDGSAHLAMKNGRFNARNVIYGPGSKLDNLMASKMACGEPMAVIERLGEGPTILSISKRPKQTTHNGVAGRYRAADRDGALRR
eukprot:147578-Prymnesium_polylepis.1